jgi:hypothetical protein
MNHPHPHHLAPKIHFNDIVPSTSRSTNDLSSFRPSDNFSSGYLSPYSHRLRHQIRDVGGGGVRMGYGGPTPTSVQWGSAGYFSRGRTAEARS